MICFKKRTISVINRLGLIMGVVCFLFSGGLLAQVQTAKVSLGIDVLEAQGFRLLKGKRVGLLTHPAGVNRDGVSTVDVMRRSPQVKLVALFGPEHGIYGNEEANNPVDNNIDKRTGLPVYSLYGKFRKPTKAMLKNLDVLVIDLQDVGVRSYTYISCMLYAMAACFENGVDIIVLDRPNPLGGLKADGPMMDVEWMSYVGAFRIPYVYGLTIGELARWASANMQKTLGRDSVIKGGKLTVVEMRNWRRSMLWNETGLKWVATSPNIPDFAAAIGYPMTGLGAQIGAFKHGVGTAHPFRLLSYPGKSAHELLSVLKGKKIAGLDFKVLNYKDRRGDKQQGVYVMIKDWNALSLTKLNFIMMQLTCQWSAKNPFINASKGDIELFNKHVGSSEWLKELRQRGANARVRYFVDYWLVDARRFHKESERFWLYK